MHATRKLAVLLQSSTLVFTVTAICGVESSQYSNFLKTSSGPLGSLGGSFEPTCLRACRKNRYVDYFMIFKYTLCEVLKQEFSFLIRHQEYILEVTELVQYVQVHCLRIII